MNLNLPGRREALRFIAFWLAFCALVTLVAAGAILVQGAVL